METSLLYISSRVAVIKINDGSKYNTKQEYRLVVSGNELSNTISPVINEIRTTDKVITPLYNLKPNTEYTVCVYTYDSDAPHANKSSSTAPLSVIAFRTKYETETLNVKAFGAFGDGIHDDTAAISAAIMCAAKDSRVLIPEGKYFTHGLFLKSGLKLEIARGAEIILTTKAEDIPILPAVTPYYDESDDRILSSWEGNPLSTRAAALTAIGADNVLIYGEGVINGQASYDNWWTFDKNHFTVGRPKLLYFLNCNCLTLIGLTLKDSPSWTIHPQNCDKLSIYCTEVQNPKDSPNTDGLDPECVTNTKIMGMHFSLGDDCIAIKSSKIYLANRYGKTTSDMIISNCLMEYGHGAVTVGSEIAGGVFNVTVKDCIFHDTDRGLRIKTRRGRGEKSIIDAVSFENIEMKHVLAPFTINEFYFCDPDGHTPYVQDKNPAPVDYRTPTIKRLSFKNIDAVDAEYCASYFLGLPEKPIEEVSMENITVTFAENAKAGDAIMADGIDKVCKAGIIAENVKHISKKNVVIDGKLVD